MKTKEPKSDVLKSEIQMQLEHVRKTVNALMIEVGSHNAKGNLKTIYGTLAYIEKLAGEL